MWQFGNRLGALALCLVVAALGGHPAAADLYGAPATFAVDGAPIAIGATDLDNDGDLDLVTANQSGSDGPTLSVLPNYGNGSLSAEERINVNGAPYILEAMGTGDFDRDGYGDIAVAVDDIRKFPPVASVLVYRNAGDGQFLEPLSYVLSGALPLCLRSADVDGDSFDDLIVCHLEAVNGAGVISILLGNADGSFRAGARVVVGSNPIDAVVADVDQDGRRDVLVLDPAAEALFLLYGSGSEGLLLEEPVAISDGGAPSGVTLHRFEPGKLPSLVVASVTGNELVRLDQIAPRQFQLADWYVVEVGPSGMEAYDLDGRPLAVLPSITGDQLTVVELGIEATEQNISIEAPTDVVVSDFDGDGRADLAAVSVTKDLALLALAGSGPAPTPTATSDVPIQTPAVTPTAEPTGATTCIPGPGCEGGEATATPISVATPTSTEILFPPTPTATATHTPGVAFGEPGDANCDGVIDELDGYAIFEQLFLQQCEGADVNGDGMVTSADLILFFMGEALP